MDNAHVRFQFRFFFFFYQNAHTHTHSSFLQTCLIHASRYSYTTLHYTRVFVTVTTRINDKETDVQINPSSMYVKMKRADEIKTYYYDRFILSGRYGRPVEQPIHPDDCSRYPILDTHDTFNIIIKANNFNLNFV